MVEKEYKFLVDRLPNEKYDDKIYIVQYYFDVKDCTKILNNYLNVKNAQLNDVKSVRLRIARKKDGVKYILNAKSNGLFSRQEYECKISKEQLNNLLNNISTIGKIEKIRYIFFRYGYNFEFDLYKNKNLTICEIEVNNGNNYNEIVQILTKKFNLSVKEVTFDERYKNYNLVMEKRYE